MQRGIRSVYYLYRSMLFLILEKNKNRILRKRLVVSRMIFQKTFCKFSYILESSESVYSGKFWISLSWKVLNPFILESFESVYSGKFWISLFWIVLNLYILESSESVYSEKFWISLFWKVLYQYILESSESVYSGKFWISLFSFSMKEVKWERSKYACRGG